MQPFLLSSMSRLALLSWTLLAVSAGSSAAGSRDPGGYYVFGDSAVEQGNLYALPGRTPPGAPYYSYGGFTRDSNGPMWVERLAAGLKPLLGADDGDRRVNFGFSGAETGLGDIADPAETGVLAQIAIFENRVAAGALTVRPEDRFIISAGPNDVIGAMIRGDDPVAAAAGVSGNLKQAAERLAAQGARTILIDDVPDFAHSPLFRTIIAGDPALEAAFDQMAQSMRDAMQSDLAELRATLPEGTQVAVIPSNDLFRKILADPQAYGFKNASDACYDDGTGSLCAPTREGQNDFLFLDGLHLTERGQQWQAAFAATFLDQLSGSVNRMIGKRSDAQIRSVEADAAAGRAEVLYPGHRAEAPGLFVTGDPGFFDSTDKDFQGRGALGLQYRQENGMVLSLGGVFSRADGDASDPDHDDNSRFGVRGSVFLPMNDSYLLVQGGLARDRFENAFRETGIPGYRPRSDQNGWSGFASVEAGHEFRTGDWTWRPHAGLTFTHARLEDVTETGGGALDMQFERADRNVLSARAGLDIETPAARIGSANLSGTLGVDVVADLMDRGNLTGRFIETSAADVRTHLGTERPVRLELTPGISYGNDDWRLGLTYRASLDEDQFTQSASLSFRVRF